MFKRLVKQIAKLVDNLQISSKRFPETLITVLGFVIIGIIMNHTDYNQRELMEKLGKILMIFIMGVPLLSAGKLLVEKLKLSVVKRIIVDMVIIGFLGVYYYFMPKEINNEFMIKYMLLSTSFYLIFSLVPYFYKKENYSRYILNLITNFFITILFSLVLYLGIDAIIFSVETLFELNIDNDIYFDVFIIVAGLFSVTHFLGHVPETDITIDKDYYPPVLRVLFVYIIIPLISIYTLILYAYFVRLIIFREFPINILGHLVVWYGLISVILLFFINHIKNVNEYTEKFYKFFPIAIMLPLSMLFAAIGNRIVDFGVTPARYFVLISGIWVLGNMIYIFFSKSFKSSVLVITAIIVLIGSAYGPQSAFSLSLNNQINRFENLLSDYSMLVNEEIIPKTDLSKEQMIKITEFVQYFDRNHSFEDLYFLPADFEYDQMKDIFGFEYTYYYSKPLDNISYFYDRESTIINISEYDYLVNVNLNIDEEVVIESEEVKIIYNDEKKILEIYKDDIGIAGFNVISFMETYHKLHGGMQPQNLEDASVVMTFDEVDILVVITNMFIEKTDNGEDVEYGSLNIRMLMKWK